MVGDPVTVFRTFNFSSHWSVEGRLFLRLAIAVLGVSFAWSTIAFSRAAPDTFANLAQELTPAVVNISTTQEVTGRGGHVPLPQFPPGSPFEDFFKDFFVPSF